MSFKKLFPCCLIILFALPIQSTPAATTTNCIQKFTFLALTKDFDPVFWIGEYTSGACSSLVLHQIAIKRNGPVAITTLFAGLETLGEWNHLKPALDRLERELPAATSETGAGAWVHDDGKVTVKPPLFDAQLEKIFRSLESNYGDLTTWKETMGANSIPLPRIEGKEFQLVYHDPNGLYINYKIAKSYYFSKSGFLLVIIDQPMLASGLNSMHGFLIFRTTESAAEPTE